MNVTRWDGDKRDQFLTSARELQRTTRTDENAFHYLCMLITIESLSRFFYAVLDCIFCRFFSPLGVHLFDTVTDRVWKRWFLLPFYMHSVSVFFLLSLNIFIFYEVSLHFVPLYAFHFPISRSIEIQAHLFGVFIIQLRQRAFFTYFPRTRWRRKDGWVNDSFHVCQRHGTNKFPLS